MIILNENLILNRNEDNNEVLYMKNASLLCKRNIIVNHIKNDDNNIFLYIKDIDFDYMRDELEIFFKDFHMNNKLFIEVENEVIEYYNDKIDISYIEI